MIFEYNITESTSEDIKLLYEQGDARLLDAVYALEQTNGLGAQGEQLYCPRGGVYLSMLLPAGDEQTLLKAASVCACRAVRRVTGKELHIRSGGRLFLDGKRAGLLTLQTPDLAAGEPADAVILSAVLYIVLPESLIPEDMDPQAGALYPDPAEIGWLGRGAGQILAEQDLGQLLLAGLRSQLMYALLEECRALAEEASVQQLLSAYDDMTADGAADADEEALQ
ncbi:MAG: hypothetical protein HUJ80_06230 [Firmicutes bacterium]|nr:hypothetical protein [Bacillota bacterium]